MSRSEIQLRVSHCRVANICENRPARAFSGMRNMGRGAANFFPTTPNFKRGGTPILAAAGWGKIFRYVHQHLECPAVVKATIVGRARFRYA